MDVEGVETARRGQSSAETGPLRTSAPRCGEKLPLRTQLSGDPTKCCTGRKQDPVSLACLSLARRGRRGVDPWGFGSPKRRESHGQGPPVAKMLNDRGGVKNEAPAAQAVERTVR